MGHARALVAVDDQKFQERVLKTIIDKGLNVRQTEEIVRQYNEPPKQKTQKTVALSDDLVKVQYDLSSKLGTKVNLKQNNNGQGTIVISFKNEEDLDKIISIIEGK